MSAGQAVEALRERLGEGQISTSRPDRIAYSGDMWPRMQLWKKMGVIDRSPPDCVAWPESLEEVRDVLKICHRLRSPVVAFGAGSGVCGGTYPLRGGVVVDVRRLKTIHSVDTESLIADVDAGILGHHLEKALEEKGVTLGHFPSSILCSTLGGWVATRSAGQLSSRYGKIEDMVLGLEVVLPSGEVLRTGLFGTAGETDWTQVFVGSEGTLGIITRVLLRLHPAPTHKAFRGFSFDSLSRAIQGMRSVMQSDIQPSVLRLYDPLDTLVSKKTKKGAEEPSVVSKLVSLLKASPDADGEGGTGWGRTKKREGKERKALFEKAQNHALHAALSQPSLLNRVIDLVPSRCLLILGTEGTQASSMGDMERLRQILLDAGGKDLGEGPGLKWHQNRYSVSFKQSRFYGMDAFVDTIEVACPWSRLVELYDEVRRTVAQRALVMAHFSHAYPEGCSIYFTFAAYRPSPSESERLYMRIWHEALTTVVRCGGTISHHHGIGLMKRDFMVREHGDGARLFKAMKAHFDPRGIMNPGKLFPDVSLERAPAKETP